MSNIAAGIALLTAAAYATVTSTAFIVAATTLIATTAYQRKRQKQAQDFKPKQDVMVRSATEPVKIVYGEVRVSGPICYVNTKPTPGSDDNSDLWHLIALAGHEVEDITDVWLDGDRIPDASINWAGDGSVTSGTYSSPSGKVNFYKQLGTAAQTAQSNLAAAFTDWTSDHRLRSVPTLTCRFEIGSKTSQGLWKNGAPQNIAAVVLGKKVYDPRLDSTSGVSGASGTHRPDDDTTWEYSNNPALCLADYLIDDRLGMGVEGVTHEDIDYDAVAAAADICDASVSIPGATTESRFTCNGALYTTSTHEDNVKAILSSMNGALRWVNGQFVMRAGAYTAPVALFDEDDILGTIQVEPERPRSERFNTVRGTFVDPDQQWARTEFLRVVDTSIKSSRDNGLALVSSFDLPMTTGEYECQRIAFQNIALNNQQTRAVVRMTWAAMQIAPGDRIQLTVSDLSWSSKVFLVERMTERPGEGFELHVREDSSSAYDDPDVADYSVRSATGQITFGAMQVPVPSGLTATAKEVGILLEWQAPRPTSAFDEVVLYASADSSWANASEVWRGNATRYLHRLAVGADRYYWVRAENQSGDESLRDPDSDTSSVTATAGEVDFADVGGSTKPEDNADVTALHSNGVENPEFEAGDKGWEKGSGWTIVEDVANARRGSWAARFSGSGVSALKSSEKPLQVEPGDRVLAQMFIKRNSNAGGVYCRIAWVNSAGSEFAYDNGPTRGDLSYLQSRVSAIAPAGAVTAEIQAVSAPSPTVTCYVDGAYMALVNTDADIDALNTTNGPAEAGADVTEDNGQPPAWLTALVDSGDIDASDVELVLNALNLINGPNEANADVTSANGQPPSWLTALIDSGDVNATSIEAVLNALNLINAPAESDATEGLIDVSDASTDGETTVSTTTWTTVQTDTVSLSGTRTIIVTITANLRRNDGNDQSRCEVRVTRNSTEVGGLSSGTFIMPGNQAFNSFVFRRRLSLSGSQTFDLDVRKISGGGDVGIRNRVITIEEVR